MSATVLPKLEEIVADITAQEAAVSEELTEVQAKLESIRAVLLLFDESGETATKAPAAKARKTKAAATKAKAVKSAKTAKSTKTAKTARAAKTAKAAKTSIRGKSKKKDGRAAAWQKYTRSGVGKQPMPEAVHMILATQPDKDFKIAEVMSSLFKDDMPKSQYLKARNRISNILSGGVRNGEWFKGERGAYRLTE